MIFLSSYGCTSAAGAGVEVFWKALMEGRNLRGESGVCHWPSDSNLVDELLKAWGEAQKNLRAPDLRNLGVILSSTKGCVEEFIWNGRPPEIPLDPISPVLEKFLFEADLKPARAICVANACASSHAALFLAKEWMNRGLVKNVLVLATDQVGRFIHSGFKALGALSGSGAKPFDVSRDGLQLGEAAAALFLSTENRGSIVLQNVLTSTENTSVTKPSSSGEGLSRVIRQLLRGENVDFIVAHGTGTKANDAAEDQAFQSVLGNSPVVVATKGCVGHTLGASGAMDAIAAAEVLRRQTLFAIPGTGQIDPGFHANYFIAGMKCPEITLERALVTSLGFGGVQAAAVLRSGA